MIECQKLRKKKFNSQSCFVFSDSFDIDSSTSSSFAVITNTQTRYRRVLQWPRDGGKTCQSLIDVRPCPLLVSSTQSKQKISYDNYSNVQYTLFAFFVCPQIVHVRLCQLELECQIVNKNHLSTVCHFYQHLYLPDAAFKSNNAHYNFHNSFFKLQ